MFATPNFQNPHPVRSDKQSVTQGGNIGVSRVGHLVEGGAPRRYSLQRLHDALGAALAQHPSPSMPTLKKWSAEGRIPWLDLDDAVRHLVESIQSGAVVLRGARPSKDWPNRETYSGGRLPSLGATPLRATAAQGHLHPSEEHPSDDRPSNDRPHPDLVALQRALVEAIGSVHVKIQSLLDSQAASPCRAQTGCASDQGVSAEVQQAIYQLDATRRHLLVQWDAQRQSMIQEAVRPHGGAGGGGAGPDILEWQRLLGRVGRMEQMLERILGWVEPRDQGVD